MDTDLEAISENQCGLVIQIMKGFARVKDADQCGVLLVGHGTRDVAGLAEFAELALLVERLIPDVKLQTAFLELATPDIQTGMDRLAEQGVDRIIVVPVLLFAAGHAKRDIPAAIEHAAARYPHIRIATTPALDCHPKLLELSEQRLRECFGSGLKPHDTALLLVGRGSLDDSATAAMHRYASLLASRVAVREYRVAFMAMAQPLLPDVLDEMIVPPDRAIVVLPHLLFRGDLLHELWTQILSASRPRPDGRILVTKHLGPDLRVAEALMESVVQLRENVRYGPM
jgi:sirohydrochlorin cobaltochelatase